MTTTLIPKTEWHIVAEEATVCNCDRGCPCQYNALPTHGMCEALTVIAIEQGHYGETNLDGVTYAEIFHWDGAVHQGNGWRRVIFDEQSSDEQRAAIEALTSGSQGHPYFDIYSSMAPNAHPSVVAPIEIERDREGRTARIRIPGFAEGDVTPIRNPVTGMEHRARIDLPNGFQFKLAEVGNATHWKTTAGDHLEMEHENTHAHFSRATWSSDGTTR